jgi:hypothetical protein
MYKYISLALSCSLLAMEQKTKYYQELKKFVPKHNYYWPSNYHQECLFPFPCRQSYKQMTTYHYYFLALSGSCEKNKRLLRDAFQAKFSRENFKNEKDLSNMGKMLNYLKASRFRARTAPFKEIDDARIKHSDFCDEMSTAVGNEISSPLKKAEEIANFFQKNPGFPIKEVETQVFMSLAVTVIHLQTILCETIKFRLRIND